MVDDDKSSSNEPDADDLPKLLELGTEIAGGVAGAAFGFIAAGPPGALAGGASGPVFTHALKRLASDVRRRMLGPREERRIGAVLAYAIEATQARLDAGERVRQDGFFDASLGDRPAAEEVAEGVLLSAQREHEERKLPYLGKLLAAIAFVPEITRDLANLLTRLGSELSFQQLVVLTVTSRPLDVPRPDYDADGADAVLAAEVDELVLRGLLARKDSSGGEWMRLHTRGIGNVLLRHMGLRELPEETVTGIEERLRRAQRP